MAFLLHIDSSIRPENSISKELTAYFAENWRQAHPDGRYVHRDLSVTPVPHLSHEVRNHLIDPEFGDHGEGEAERTLSAELVAEVREATVILFGIPMYNYTVPSTLKAWLDRMVIPPHMVMPGADSGLLSGKPVIAVCSRGGSYAPGTPREGFNFQEPYLRAVLTSIGLNENLTFVNVEMTHSLTVPPLAQFKPIYDNTRAAAFSTLKKLAETEG